MEVQREIETIELEKGSTGFNLMLLSYYFLNEYFQGLVLTLLEVRGISHFFRQHCLKFSKSFDPNFPNLPIFQIHFCGFDSKLLCSFNLVSRCKDSCDFLNLIYSVVQKLIIFVKFVLEKLKRKAFEMLVFALKYEIPRHRLRQPAYSWRFWNFYYSH